MRAKQIKVGGRYEVKAGRSTTVVKVKSVNKKTGGWKCQTANGKMMNVAAPDRFVKEVTPEKKQEPDRKPTLKEMIEAKGITVIPRGRRATSTMRDLDDPTFTRKHHVKDGVLILEADEEKPKHLGPKPLGQLSAMSAAHRVLMDARSRFARSWRRLSRKTTACSTARRFLTHSTVGFERRSKRRASNPVSSGSVSVSLPPDD